MCWGGGLLPLVLHLPDGPGSMVGGGGCSSCQVFGRGVLEFPHIRLIQTRDGLEVSLRHVMGDLAPQE